MLTENILNKLLLVGNEHMQKFDVQTGLPIWITSSADLFQLKIDAQNRVYFMQPKVPLTFDQLANVHKQIEKKLESITIIIADELSPKFRPHFVKKNIPFVYKGKSLFAPALGIKLFDYKEGQEAKKRTLEEAVGPFELKLIEGYLTGFIAPEKYNLDQLGKILSDNKYVCSKMKISRAAKQLIEMGFVKVEGQGPNRKIQFLTKEKVWEELRHRAVKSYFKTFETSFEVQNNNFVFSGETALAQLSMLSAPNVQHIGMTNKEFLEIQTKQMEEIAAQHKTVFEIFKESPRLFAVKDCLNPIEIYLAFKNHHDERIQMSLKEMLATYNLEVNDDAT